MKRFHVHISVPALDDAVRFYSGLFGAAPTVHKADYAKWMIDDPRVNFAISQRGAAPGLNHLGVQVGSDEELLEMEKRLDMMGAGYVAEPGAACCYARSDKYWARDPVGIAWETYHTLDTIPMFNDGAEEHACCVPAADPEAAATDGCCTTSTPGNAGSACC
ncbi:MAG: VOC family protein [Betaproteobacteria bacterium]|jgi:catechol 2,3-dioxygenase-like lactoylglutathione lyase family enzyme|nr:VOC family protein [Betaproteobacteria bacterium]